MARKPAAGDATPTGTDEKAVTPPPSANRGTAKSGDAAKKPATGARKRNTRSTSAAKRGPKAKTPTARTTTSAAPAAPTSRTSTAANQQRQSDRTATQAPQSDTPGAQTTVAEGGSRGMAELWRALGVVGFGTVSLALIGLSTLGGLVQSVLRASRPDAAPPLTGFQKAVAAYLQQIIDYLSASDPSAEPPFPFSDFPSPRGTGPDDATP